MRPIVFLLLAACASDSLPSDAPAGVADTAPAISRITEGTATAQGMLAFLNDPTTTFELLDVDVALDARAAGSIIAWRDGVDAVNGTTDDRPISTVAEVDAGYYVGDSALGKIQAWAEENAWVPTDPDDLLGTWDGVSFTVAEAEAVLILANTGDADYLDDDLAMDARAVDSIVDARPIDTVYTLSGLY